MKRYLAISLILLIIAGILFLSTFIHDQAKPILTTEEKIKKLNAYVNNSLYASENNMYLKIYSSNSLITIDEFPELKEIVSNLNHSIKIKEEYERDKFEYDKPQRIYFSWGNTKIIIDIDTNLSSNQIYIENNAALYKAEASTESIHQIAEFVAKIK